MPLETRRAQRTLSRYSVRRVKCCSRALALNPKRAQALGYRGVLRHPIGATVRARADDERRAGLDKDRAARLDAVLKGAMRDGDEGLARQRV